MEPEPTLLEAARQQRDRNTTRTAPERLLVGLIGFGLSADALTAAAALCVELDAQVADEQATYKRCTGCGQRKPRAEFARNAHNRTGLRCRCRVCEAKPACVAELVAA